MWRGAVAMLHFKTQVGDLTSLHGGKYRCIHGTLLATAAMPADANTSSHTKPPHTTTQDRPRGSITDPAASPASNQPGADSAHIGTDRGADEAHTAGIDRYEGEPLAMTA